MRAAVCGHPRSRRRPGEPAKAASSGHGSCSTPDGDEPGSKPCASRHRATTTATPGSGHRPSAPRRSRSARAGRTKAKPSRFRRTVAAFRLRRFAHRYRLKTASENDKGQFFNGTPSPSTARTPSRLTSCPQPQVPSAEHRIDDRAGRGPRARSQAPGSRTKKPRRRRRQAGPDSTGRTSPDGPPSGRTFRGPSRAPLLFIRNGERS